MNRIPRVFVFLVFAFASALTAFAADTVVQIDVSSLLNARAVTTLTDGKLVPWTVGIDGNGTGDGYMTMAASLFNGDKSPHALPDSSHLPANARHPEIDLHYSNADGTGQQTHYVRGADSFTVAVPEAVYAKLFLVLTSSEGTSTLTLKLNYADGSETKNLVLPDYYNPIPETDTTMFNLVTDLGKWTKANKEAELSHHNIDAVELHPAAGRTLRSVQVKKTAPGYMVFWAATGVAVSPVTSVLPKRRDMGILRVTGQGAGLRALGLEFTAQPDARAFSAAGRLLPKNPEK